MSPRLNADPTIGERIRDRRLLRGWSIRYAASRAGISHATWSRIERGSQAADNRFMLADIAVALECSPAELAGMPVPVTDRAAMAAQTGVYGIRRALVDLDLAERATRPALPVADLARTAALVNNLRQACDYAGAARLIPDLLRDLHAASSGPQRQAALRLLCDATFIASSVVRNLGHPAEAWLAAERCRDVAEADRAAIRSPACGSGNDGDAVVDPPSRSTSDEVRAEAQSCGRVGALTRTTVRTARRCGATSSSGR